jgi:transketolase
MAAGHFRAGRLVCVVDRNRLGIDGPTEEIMTADLIEARFEAFGCAAQRVNGHDLAALVAAFDVPTDVENGSPQLIVVDTVKGPLNETAKVDINRAFDIQCHRNGIGISVLL